MMEIIDVTTGDGFAASCKRNTYSKDLGYIDADVETSTSTVECLHCGRRMPRAGDVMRSHRRRCEVVSFDPYTPGAARA